MSRLPLITWPAVRQFRNRLLAWRQICQQRGAKLWRLSAARGHMREINGRKRLKLPKRHPFGFYMNSHHRSFAPFEPVRTLLLHRGLWCLVGRRAPSGRRWAPVAVWVCLSWVVKMILFMDVVFYLGKYCNLFLSCIIVSCHLYRLARARARVRVL